MSLGHGTSISRSGLVFHYDMENSAKSWKGKPTTNLIATDLTGYTKDNGCTVTATGEYFQGSPVYRVVFNSGTLPRIRTNFAYTAQQYNGSIYYKVVTQGSHYAALYFREINFGTSYVASTLNSTSWTRANINYTFSASGTAMFLLYQANSNSTSDTVIDFAMPQSEVGSFATPYVNGTRSQSNALSDISGGANSIYLNSLVYPSDGTFSFNGSHFMDISNVPINVNSFTIEAFVKIPSTTNINKTIVGIGDGSTNGLWFFKHRSGLGNKLVFHGWDGVNPRIDVISADTTPDNETFQAVVKYSDGTYTLYMNGEVNGTPVADNSIASSTTAYIGRHVSTSYVEGNIFDVKIYNRALSDAEVKQNFNATRGRYGI